MAPVTYRDKHQRRFSDWTRGCAMLEQSPQASTNAQDRTTPKGTPEDDTPIRSRYGKVVLASTFAVAYRLLQ